ncbi:hypothetical protein [Oleisolibacter albus]|uniref:hypothetical protein n=1 Tax=Oleisolibacter albus TaxID=2171757 RepID=UPI000DF32A94|nr:hypothetical protein [Oleisolibacter albus]
MFLTHSDAVAPVTTPHLTVRLLTLYAPALSFILILFLEGQLQWPLTGTEMGPVESLQVLLLLLGIGYGLRCWHHCRRQDPAHSWWFLLAVAGCTYAMLEEISYGQHLLHWATPDLWQQLNDQGETNLHNTSAWFDQKPRIILEIGVLAGLVIALRRWRGRPVRLGWLTPVLPGSAMLMPGLLAVAAFMLDSILTNGFDLSFGLARPSELEELFLYWSVLAYLAGFAQEAARRR